MEQRDVLYPRKSTVNGISHSIIGKEQRINVLKIGNAV
jgi:hypothetical protein